MKILFLHSGHEVTGATTYARALAQAWRGRHTVYWVGDRLEEGEHALALPMHRKLLPHGFLNARRVAQWVRRERIDVMHAHARSANTVADLVSRWTGVPYVTTAHLRMKRHFFNRHWPRLGTRVIAICETIATYLQEAFGIAPARIRLIRNGIDLEQFKPQPPAGAGNWVTILGRLSGLRWHTAPRLLAIVPELRRRVPNVRFRFVGGVAPERGSELEALLRGVNAGLAVPTVEAVGHVEDPRPLIAGSAAVIAAGRSLLEAMAMEVPVINVGEETSFGLMTPESFARAQSSNFGDFAQSNRGVYDREPTLDGIQKALSGSADLAPLRRWGRERVAQEYDVRRIAEQVEELYQEVIS